MGDILTFRANPADKKAIKRILRENPNLGNNTSAAIRTGLMAYERYQNWQQRREVQLTGEVFAHELADNYQILLERPARVEYMEFNKWLVRYTFKPVDESLPKALVEGRTPVARSQSEDGAERVDWFLIGDVVVGQGSGEIWHWYLVPVKMRGEMPAIVV